MHELAEVSDLARELGGTSKNLLRSAISFSRSQVSGLTKKLEVAE